MKFKIKLPDKSEMAFDDKETAIRTAKQHAIKTNKLIAVDVTKDGFEWEQVALVYPTGQVQEGTGGFGFFKNLPVKRVKR
jgi:hypothetical protein